MPRPTRSSNRILLGGLLMATLTAAAANPPGVVQGQWGGDQMRLVVDTQGGHLTAACADGSFSGPITLAADGSFQVSGVFDQHTPGPQRADEAASHAQARFSGEIRNGVMTLSILRAGASDAQVFNLRRGQAAKIVRCL